MQLNGGMAGKRGKIDIMEMESAGDSQRDRGVG